ncbi:hypothetical protein GCM10022398_23310 [Acetobacter lovaniensis]|nr:hypothetical protein AA0474_0502 [Acetobacter lovaniensis NRIC 0474]
MADNAADIAQCQVMRLQQTYCLFKGSPALVGKVYPPELGGMQPGKLKAPSRLHDLRTTGDGTWRPCQGFIFHHGMMM